jgi:hypothetical protein
MILVLKVDAFWIVIGTELWLLFDLIYFYEQYPYYSLSYSHFFAHYNPLTIPISFLHALFNKIKLKLCMTVVKDDTEIGGS